MEERTTNGFSQGRQLLFRFLRNDRFLIFLLLALATLIRGWHLAHTEVTSRDSIGFERYAWELQHKDWKQVVRENVHHPLYPLTILGMSMVVRLFDDSALAIMQLSAQLASGLAGILLVIPMFLLGKELFDRRVGFWATAMFQCFPVAGRVMSDGLSEPLFLTISALGLLLAVQGLRSGSPIRLILCGLCAGLAYLTRPEGILLGVSVGLVLLAQQIIPAWRRAWRWTMIRFVSLTAAALIVALPYVAIIGGISNKLNTKEILQTSRNWAPCPPLIVQGPLFAFMPATWWPDGRESDVREHLAWAVYALASEIIKAFFYVAWLPALLGLYWFRRQLKLFPHAWVLLVLCLLQGLALFRVALVAGYVSDRHVLIIVLCGLYWAVAAVFKTTTRSVSIRARSVREGNTRETRPATAWRYGLVLTLAALALTKTLAPLHTNRAGHHAVGLWLAQHAEPADEIVDPFCWAAHYAGRTFLPANPVLDDQNICRHRYIVHECRPDHREKYRPPSIPEADIRAASGKIVYHWPSESPLSEAKILLYDVSLPAKNNATLPLYLASKS